MRGDEEGGQYGGGRYAMAVPRVVVGAKRRQPWRTRSAVRIRRPRYSICMYFSVDLPSGPETAFLAVVWKHAGCYCSV